MVKSCDTVSRRSVLNKASALSGLVLTSGVVAGENEDSGTTVITTVAAGATPKQTKTVSEKWWDQRRRARQVVFDLKQQYSDSEGIVDVALINHTKKINGRKTGQAIVYLHPEKGTDEDIPEKSNGVHVRQDEQEIEEPNCNKGSFDPVPGGVAVDENDNSGSCTACYPVYDPDTGNRYLMTAAHCVDICTDDPAVSIYQPGSGDTYIGDGVYWSEDSDVLFIELASDTELDYGFSDHIEDAPTPVVGRVTESGVHDLKSNGTTVNLFGINSCTDYGEVTSMYNELYTGTCIGDHSHFVKINNDSQGGDSGGPYYHDYYNSNLNREETAVIGQHSASGSDYSKGIGAYYIYDSWGYEFT